jgi:flagella basal body P-ring formation protein FlgA
VQISICSFLRNKFRTPKLILYEEKTMTHQNIDLLEPTGPGQVPLQEVAIRLHPQDQVAIAKENLQPGTILTPAEDDPFPEISVRGFIPSGHKIALSEISPGQTVRR